MIKISGTKLAVAIVGVIAASIALSSAFGLWQTTSSKQPAKIKAGEFSGLPNPSDIRGSYSWQDVAKNFNIPLESLLKAFQMTNAGGRLSELETVYGGKLGANMELGTDSVRLFVALYTGLPHKPEETTVLLDQAMPILLAEGAANKELIKATKTVAIGAAPVAASAAPAEKPATQAAPAAATPAGTATAAPTAEVHQPNPQGASNPGSAFVFTGKTSFNDLKTWGFDMKKVSAIMGGLGQSAQSLKDYCAQKGLAYSEIKAKLWEIEPKK